MKTSLAVPLRKLPCHEHQVARLHKRHVVRTWDSGLGQLETTFDEPAVYVCGHISLR